LKNRALFLCLFLWPAIAAAQTAANDALVDSFYPSALVADFADFATPQMTLNRSASYVAADLDGSGRQDYLVAAYTNGRRGAVVVLKKSGSGATVVDAPDLPAMGGSFLRVELIDIEGDGRPEVVVAGIGMHDESDWIFKWTAGHLAVFGPTETTNDVVAPSIINADFADLDGDGVLEVIGGSILGAARPDGTHEPSEPFTVYWLQGGAFVKSASPVAWYAEFLRDKGSPNKFAETIVVGKPAGSWELRVANGDTNGKNAVTSGTVKLNGQVVLAPNDFKAKEQRFSVPVTVKPENSIEIELASAPGSRLSLQIVKGE